MKTVTIQIGNSDDGLTQREWSAYVGMVGEELHLSVWEIHFSGASSSVSKYQNACWVFEIKETNMFGLQQELRSIRNQFRQKSLSWTVGETEFI